MLTKRPLRTAWVLVGSLVAGCAAVPKATVPMASVRLDRQAKSFNPRPGKANIYVYRRGVVGSAVVLQVLVDGRYAGLLARDTFQTLSVAPGRHTVEIIAVPGMPPITEPDTRIVVSAGEDCFFAVRLHLGLTKATVELAAIGQAQGRRTVSTLRLAETAVEEAAEERKFIEGLARLRKGMTATQVAALLPLSPIDPTMIDNTIAEYSGATVRLGSHALVFDRQGLESCSDCTLLPALERAPRAHAGVLARINEDLHGLTPWEAAIERGDTGAVESLLARGADLNTRLENGMTPLQLAAVSGRQNVVRLLLAHKADRNARDADGNTALFWAARGGHLNVVAVLLDRVGMQLSGLDPQGRRQVLATLSQAGVVVVDGKTLQFLQSLGADVVFYTRRDHPIETLADITDPDTQFATLEFSARMMRLRQFLADKPPLSAAPGTRTPSGAVDAAGGATFFGAGVRYGAAGTLYASHGVSFMRAGGLTLMGIPQSHFGKLFEKYPQLRLFAAVRNANVSPIVKTGGGMRICFIQME